MQVAVGKDNEADFLTLSINTGLFFAVEGSLSSDLASSTAQGKPFSSSSRKSIKPFLTCSKFSPKASTSTGGPVGFSVYAITKGPDGNLWFTEPNIMGINR